MALTLFVPEVILGLAAANLYAAVINTPIVQKKASDDGVPWTLSHTFFANIGGISIRFPDETGAPLSEDLGLSPAPGADRAETATATPVARNRLWGINYGDPEYNLDGNLELRRLWRWNRILDGRRSLIGAAK